MPWAVKFWISPVLGSTKMWFLLSSLQISGDTNSKVSVASTLFMVLKGKRLKPGFSWRNLRLFSGFLSKILFAEAAFYVSGKKMFPVLIVLGISTILNAI